MEIEKWIEAGFELITVFGPKVIAAIAIWIIGSWVIKKLTIGLAKVLSARDYDLSLQTFLMNLVNWSLKVVLVVIIMGTLGIETASFAAVIAAAGLAIGLAMQGSLANFAGGVLIMIFKPFKIGDVIEAQGEVGSVKEIQIFTTKLANGQNKEIILPNGTLSNNKIINFTSRGTMRVDLTVGIGYDDDIKKAKEVLMNVLTSHDMVLQDPAPAVAVHTLGDSAIILVVRPHVKSENYWTVHFDITEAMKYALDEAGISIPYPQRDVHMHQAK